MANYSSLREANVARNIEWTGGQSIEDYTWRGCELGGEVGEVVDLLSGTAGYDGAALLEELADVVICIDLAGMTLGIREIPIFSQGSIGLGGIVREAYLIARHVLLMQNDFKKLERERRGWPGSRAKMEDMELRLMFLMGRIGCIASYYRLNLAEGTARKFNATSHKVGLVTRLLHNGLVA